MGNHSVDVSRKRERKREMDGILLILWSVASGRRPLRDLGVGGRVLVRMKESIH